MNLQETLSFYIDTAGQWRWRVVDEGNKVVAGAESGYDAKADCQADAEANGYALEEVLFVDTEAPSPVYF